MDRVEYGCLGGVGHRDHCWPESDTVGEKGQWCWCRCQPHSLRLLPCDTSTAPLEEQGPYLPCFLTWGSQTLQYSFPRLTASQMLPSVHPMLTEHSLHPSHFARDSELHRENTQSLFSQGIRSFSSKTHLLCETALHLCFPHKSDSFLYFSRLCMGINYSKFSHCIIDCLNLGIPWPTVIAMRTGLKSCTSLFSYCLK